MTRDCHRWEPLLLDYLYDLLDAEEAYALEAHLQACPQCRQGLTQAKRQQKLIGAAARREFPMVRFEPPSEAVPSEAAPGEEAIVVGLPKVRRSWDWKPWAVAASILLVLSIVAPPAYFLLRERPQTVLPGESGHWEVASPERNPSGPLTAPEKQAQSETFALQDALASQGFVFQAHGHPSFLRNRIPTEYPFVAHLATDKTTYQPGETVHFWAFALDSLSLAPGQAEPPLDISFIAQDSQGQELTAEPGDHHSVEGESGHGLPVVTFRSLALPVQAASGRYSLQVRERRNRFAPSTVFFDVSPTLAKSPSVVPAGDQQHVAEVELYPEGGRLIAGVVNRVYFRVNNGISADPARPDAAQEHWKARLLDAHNRTLLGTDQIIRPKGAAILADRGRFSFVPQHGQRYRLEVENPHWGRRVSRWLEAVSSGVVVQVPDSVLENGSAIPLRIVSVGRDRQLQLTLECRSRILGHREIQVPAGVETPVEIVPTPAVSGVCRLTVWEQSAAPTEWIPIAERLVLFLPKAAPRLEITAARTGTGPSSSAVLNLRAVDEPNRPVPGLWTLSVRLRSTGEPPTGSGTEAASLPVKLYLGPEIVSEDMALAKAVWNQPAHGNESLDLLLGTQPVRFLHTSGPRGDVMVVLQDRAARSFRKETERQIRKSDESQSRNAEVKAAPADGQKGPTAPQDPARPKATEAKGLNQAKKEMPGAAGLVTAEKADGSPAPSAPGAPGFGQGGLPARPMLNEADKPLAGAAASSPAIRGESALRRAAAPSPEARQRPGGPTSGSTIVLDPALLLPNGIGRVELGQLAPDAELEIRAEVVTLDGRLASQTIRLRIPDEKGRP